MSDEQFDNGIAGDTVLNTALIWWPLALLLAGVYFFLAYHMLIRPAGAPQVGGPPAAER
jgi:hypothetical protein